MFLVVYLSDTVDAYIYIFKYSPVRESLFRTLRARLPPFHNAVHIEGEPDIPGPNKVSSNDSKQNESPATNLEEGSF